MDKTQQTNRKKEIGELIKSRRIAIGYNQDELAKLIGMPSGRRTLIPIEQGKRYMQIEHIRAAAQILCLPIDRLIP